MKLETYYAEQIVSHFEKLYKEGLVRLWWIKKMKKENLSIKEVNVSKDLGPFYNTFNEIALQNEIRKNILNCPDDKTLAKYFHYLVKIEWSLKENALKYSNARDEFNEFRDGEDWPVYDFGTNKNPYNTEDELKGHCKFLFFAPSFFSINFHVMLVEEFRYDIEKWKEHIANKKGMPSYNEVESFLSKGIGKVGDQKINQSDLQHTGQKLNWLGTPSQFGFIIDLLIQGGYLEKPTGSFGKDAVFYLNHFNIDTTEGTLIKEISEKSNNLSAANRKKIIIPHKDKLT